MIYSKNQIKDKLISCYMKDLINNRYFYSLKDVLKEFEIKHFEIGIIAQTKIRKKLDSMTYPCGKIMFQLQKNAGGIVEDVYMSPTGLMFSLATLSQMLTNKKEKDKYKTYSLIASTFILLGGLILLYNAIFDNTIEEEIALE